MIIDPNNEFNSAWFVAPWNPGIGPVQPNVATVTPASAGNPNLQVYIDGPSGYSNMLAALHRPFMPLSNLGNLSKVAFSFSFNLITDKNIGLLQALEFEVRPVFIDQHGRCCNVNNCMQMNFVNPKGAIQAYASPTNVWADTGIRIPPLEPKETYPIQVNYVTDMLNGFNSTPSVTIMGKTYPLPAMFQNVPAPIMSPPWTSAMYMQIQMDLAKAGGKVMTEYNDMNINWN